MALRTIRTGDDPCLTKACRPVERFDGRLKELLDDMFETMYHADGVGLAGEERVTTKEVLRFEEVK